MTGPTGPSILASSFNVSVLPVTLQTTPTLLATSQITAGIGSNLWIMSTIEYRTLDTPYLLAFYIQVDLSNSITTFSSTTNFNQYSVISLQHRASVTPGAHTIRVYGYAPALQVAEIRHCDVFAISNLG
jgi:hypothetical protein